MPYDPKLVPAARAIKHVMEVDGCDRLVAIFQIELWAKENPHVWVRGGSNRFGWDAEIFRDRLLKQWPNTRSTLPRAAEEQMIAGGDVPPPGNGASTPRGPRAKVRERVEAAMREKIADCSLTRERLREMREKELEHDFGASRDTCRKARKAVLDSPSRHLSKLNSRQTATNDK
jgi:hypothetical protein